LRARTRADVDPWIGERARGLLVSLAAVDGSMSAGRRFRAVRLHDQNTATTDAHAPHAALRAVPYGR
jgi:hypothetical protein